MLSTTLLHRLSRIVFAAGLLAMASSCVNPADTYRGRRPGAENYYGQPVRRWEFTPWGIMYRGKQLSPTAPALPRYRDPSYWNGEGISGKPRIHIDISDQMAYFHKGKELVGASQICTGSAEFPTPTGNFSVIEKDADHLSSVYGDYIDADGNIIKTQIDNRKDPRPRGTKFDGAQMHWFLRVTGGVGMHEGFLPGYADSHGCIRLPSHMAEIFYENAPLGTPVKITP